MITTTVSSILIEYQLVNWSPLQNFVTIIGNNSPWKSENRANFHILLCYSAPAWHSQWFNTGQSSLDNKMLNYIRKCKLLVVEVIYKKTNQSWDVDYFFKFCHFIPFCLWLGGGWFTERNKLKPIQTLRLGLRVIIWGTWQRGGKLSAASAVWTLISLSEVENWTHFTRY